MRLKFAVAPQQIIDFALGAMAAVPFAYPAEPLYWIALLAFALALPSMRLDQEGYWRLLLVVALCIIVLMANFVGLQKYPVYPASIGGTLLIFTMFLFRYGVREVERFFDGFLFVVTVYALLTFVHFFVLKPYTHGWVMFVSSSVRMWGDGYLLEWPNVFCVFLSLGFLIRWMRGEHFFALLTLGAALLTTSRIALVALGVCVIFEMMRNRTLLLIVIACAVPLTVYLVLSTIQIGETGTVYLEQRLFKVVDRLLIYSTLLETFLFNPFGIGNVQFTSIGSGYFSYHSSFLKIAVRYGFLGLILFLLLIKPTNLWHHKTARVNAPIVFFLIIGVFQDMLLHMHLILVYTVFLAYREKVVHARSGFPVADTSQALQRSQSGHSSIAER